MLLVLLLLCGHCSAARVTRAVLLQAISVRVVVWQTINLTMLMLLLMRLYGRCCLVCGIERFWNVACEGKLACYIGRAGSWWRGQWTFGFANGMCRWRREARLMAAIGGFW